VVGWRRESDRPRPGSFSGLPDYPNADVVLEFEPLCDPDLEGETGMNLLWFQSGCCGGESMSLLNSEQPDLLTTFRLLGIKILWHPTLCTEMGSDVTDVLQQCLDGQERLDVFVVEGAVYLGPNGTGLYSTLRQRPIMEWIKGLAKIAHTVLAVGTCASFGGIAAAGKNPMDATGMQFFRSEKGGLLGTDFLSKSGLPVVNLPGCPAHPDWMVETFLALSSGEFGLQDLDRFQRPKGFYGKLAHHACPRNEYYEFKASAQIYSQQGCLFENLGCKATQCESDCNERLWMGRTGSCTRGGFPCISCTSPRFPDGFVPFFETKKIGDIPITLPLDVPKAWYVGISGLAKLACPERVRINAVSFKQENIEDKSETE